MFFIFIHYHWICATARSISFPKSSKKKSCNLQVAKKDSPKPATQMPCIFNKISIIICTNDFEQEYANTYAYIEKHRY